MHRLLFASIIAFAGGVALRSFFDFGAAFLVLLGGISAALLLCCLRLRSRGAVLILIAVAAFGVGIARMDIAEQMNTPRLDAAVGTETTIIGVVADEADERSHHRKLTLETEQIQTPDGIAYTQDRVLVIADRFPAFSYGDRLRIRGELMAPDNFSHGEEPGAPFDYVGYLAKDGIHYQMFYPESELLDTNAGHPLYAALFSFKNALLTRISRVIPEPHAALAGGITFGAKRALGEDLLDRFRTTGLIHIVVLSGYNISIVVYALRSVLARLPFVISIGMSLAAIAGFVIMVGAGATALRAGAMAILALAAQVTGRPYAVLNALFVAGAFMIFINPFTLMSDPSFQLSFMATFGLITFAPRMAAFLSWIPEKFALREIAAATLATQLFVLPLIVFMMGTLSLIAPLANILVLPLVPSAMAFVAAAGFVSTISHGAGILAGSVAYGPLKAITAINAALSELPFASLTIASVPLWVIAVMYGALFTVVAAQQKEY